MMIKFILFLALFFQTVSADIIEDTLFKRGIIYKKKLKQTKVRNLFIEKDRVSIHLNKLKVIEDYDDLINDDIYLYVITTIANKIHLKLTNVYRGLDEGDSFYFFPDDRILARNIDLRKGPVIIDFGIIEADGEDINILKQLISDLSLVTPIGGVLSSQYAQAIKVFFHAVANLKDDTRLVTDTIVIQKGQLKSFEEHEFIYSGERYWSEYKYLVNFRIFTEMEVEYVY